jgi:hypothetical protein
MSRENVLIMLGVLVALSPYLGLPLSVLGIILPILGLLIIGIGVTLRIRMVQSTRGREASGSPVPVYEMPEA